MKFDDFFHIQDARADLCHDPISLNGTENYPVGVIGKIDRLDIDTTLDILGPSSPFLPADEITIRLIMSQLHPYGLPEVGFPHYMQFLFYDFDRAINLFLLNAKITEVRSIYKNHGGLRRGLIITSIKCDDKAAYETLETKHDVAWSGG